MVRSSALNSPHWYAVMKEEPSALHHNDTWDLVPRDPEMNVVDWRAFGMHYSTGRDYVLPLIDAVYRTLYFLYSVRIEV